MRAPRATRLGVAAVVVAALLPAALAAPAREPASQRAAGSGYEAVIRRTSYGIPHVLADTWGDAGFGQGWAYAEDRLCDLADQVVKVRSQRSRWFGPGEGLNNLGTDLGYAGLGLMERAREQAGRLSGDARQILDGYVAGYNAYLAQTGVENAPGWCAGQPWVGPITVVDLLAYQRDVAISDSGAQMLGAVALAQPPVPGAAARTDPLVAGGSGGGSALPGAGAVPSGGLDADGSNGWALGADRSAKGRGMVVANPHYPWQGERKFWEVQLTIPGRLNVYGAALGGIPGVQIGFNDHVAWTHTVASGARYTIYTLDLVPGDPTTYLVDGRPEPMTARSVSVDVDWGDGRPQPLTRTLWSTRYGPVLDLSTLDPALGWTGARAITYRDANIDNDALMRQWLDIGRARDVAGVRDAIGRVQGIPWVNTLAADERGNAWYADAAATPNLPPAAQAQWRSRPWAPLDGSDSRNAWVNEPGARSPGLIPFADQPQLLRRDYVLNANDSHWFVNEHRLLTGFSPLQGAEGAPLTARTRQNLRLLQGEPRFDLPGLTRAILSGSALTSDLLTPYVVAACQARGGDPVPVDGSLVDIRAACRALAGWDRRFDVDSRGAVLWRETVRSVVSVQPAALTEAGALFGVGFDPADPGRTPRGTPDDPTALLTGLARAQARLADLGLPPDVRLGDVQQTVKGEQRFPVPGSGAEVGIANVVGYSAQPGSSREPVMDGGKARPGTDLTERGYVVNSGTSFVMVVEFTDRGPVGRCLLTFGQSADPDSAHHSDQTALFGRGQLRECRFSEASIRSDQRLTRRVVRGQPGQGTGASAAANSPAR